MAAGSLGDAERARNDAAEAQAITQANFTGLIPWLTAIVSPERIEQPGASGCFLQWRQTVAGPPTTTTAPPKPARCAFEGLLLRCHGTPFAVRILKAGFIASPMTDARPPPAALCQARADRARSVAQTLPPWHRNDPWWWSPLMSMVRRLPAQLPPSSNADNDHPPAGAAPIPAPPRSANPQRLSRSREFVAAASPAS